MYRYNIIIIFTALREQSKNQFLMYRLFGEWIIRIGRRSNLKRIEYLLYINFYNMDLRKRGYRTIYSYTQPVVYVTG